MRRITVEIRDDIYEMLRMRVELKREVFKRGKITIGSEINSILEEYFKGKPNERKKTNRQRLSD